MTLVETLVGLVLLGFLATLILAGGRLGGQVWTRAERQAAQTADMDTLHSLLRWTIASAYPSFASPEMRDRRVSFYGRSDAMTFIAPEPGALDDRGWAEMRLHLAPQGGETALFLAWHLDLTPADGNAALPDNEVLLLSHVSALRLAYFGSPGEEEAPAWLDRWTDRDRLPQLVRIRLERDNPKLPAWTELVVRPRVTTNVSCAYDAIAIDCRRIP